jgi:hypothetical protein
MDYDPLDENFASYEGGDFSYRYGTSKPEGKPGEGPVAYVCGPSAHLRSRALSRQNCEVVIVGQTTISGSPYKVVRIEESAFRDLDFVTSVRFATTVVAIGPHGFYGCPCLKVVDFDRESQLKEIGPRAFMYTAIEKILLPPSLRVIGTCAFLGCAKLSQVDFEGQSNLEVIEAHAFTFTALATINIPKRAAVDRDAFVGCPKLKLEPQRM